MCGEKIFFSYTFLIYTRGECATVAARIEGETRLQSPWDTRELVLEMKSHQTSPGPRVLAI